jgi:hypothetical protein
MFCLAYLANGYNAAAAYRSSHPRCRSAVAARVEGHRLLTDPNVVQFIAEEQQARNRRLRMDGDEVMARIAAIARADIAHLFDEHGRTLPPWEWPESVRIAVKTFRRGRNGDTIVLHDGLRACELIARAAGRLGGQAQVNPGFDHAAYLVGLDTPPEPGRISVLAP